MGYLQVGQLKIAQRLPGYQDESKIRLFPSPWQEEKDKSFLHFENLE
jgi:hypothetical protein